MIGGKSIQAGAGRYYQDFGALKRLGKEIREYGDRAVIFYADETVRGKTCDRARASLETSQVEYLEVTFDKSATTKHFAEATKLVSDFHADIVVGIGGGRILDIAKSASDAAGVGVITVPTSAATCAAYALLCVEYSEAGNIASSNFMKHEAKGVLVDLDYAVLDCPSRYFISGMVDAMAKYPEYTFTTLCLGEEGQIAPLRCAMVVAKETYRYYLEKGAEAVRDFESGHVTPLVEDMINLNIMMTGILSDLSVGGKSLALAHNFYEAICYLHKDIRKKFLHGELVAMALPMQLYVNGAPETDIKALQAFLREVRVPVTLQDIGFPEGEEIFAALCEYVYTSTKYESESLRVKIREGLQMIQ